jgi:hypothetical protein
MILDIPTPEELEVTGISLLNLAWDVVSALYLDLESSQMNEWDDDGQITDEFWQAAQRPLANAFTLTQQGAEFLLKARIAQTSPFLLIDGTPRDWPRGCHEHDTPYSDFRTIDAQDLIRVHDTVRDERLDGAFCQRFDILRRTRNAIMHSVNKRLRHSPSDIWKSVLDVSHHLVAPHRWIAARRNYLESTPSSIAFSTDGIRWQLSWECVQLLRILQPAEARDLLGVDLKRRWYICCKCTEGYSHYVELPPKTAQLYPNDPASTAVYCFVCDTAAVIHRKDCVHSDCKGNVIQSINDVCLTCYGNQS